MPLDAPAFPFVLALIREAPEVEGVYALWRDGEVIYYGQSFGGHTIRSCLRQHLLDSAGHQATHYSWEVCFDPRQRARELLARHVEKFGGFPRFNAL